MLRAEQGDDQEMGRCRKESRMHADCRTRIWIWKAYAGSLAKFGELVDDSAVLYSVSGGRTRAKSQL